MVIFLYRLAKLWQICRQKPTLLSILLYIFL